VSGADLDAGIPAAAYARAEAATGKSTVRDTGARMSAALAAFANGMAAHVDETDDSHPTSLSHPDCSIVPATGPWLRDTEAGAPARRNAWRSLIQC
jgi:2-methylcitrate dehydratase PrpD